jgi:hypothetical protein
MAQLENAVRSLLNLEYTYEHIGSVGIQERVVGSHPTAYVYFKAEELLPLLQLLGEMIDDK